MSRCKTSEETKKLRRLGSFACGGLHNRIINKVAAIRAFPLLIILSSHSSQLLCCSGLGQGQEGVFNRDKRVLSLRGSGGMAFKFDFGGDSAAGGGDAGGFKFNFGADDGAEPVEHGKPPFHFDEHRTTPAGMTPSREMPADYDKEEEMDEMAMEALFEDVVFADGAVMKRVTPPNLESMPGPLAQIVDKSDLVPGVYEGGFKVWEGSVDLVNYLVKEKINLKGLKVIELGCGHAFPGMHAAMEGAHVDLQDYNEEVISEITMMNVIANLKGVDRQPRYFCGDWGSLASVTGSKCYGE